MHLSTFPLLHPTTLWSAACNQLLLQSQESRVGRHAIHYRTLLSKLTYLKKEIDMFELYWLIAYLGTAYYLLLSGPIKQPYPSLCTPLYALDYRYSILEWNPYLLNRLGGMLRTSQHWSAWIWALNWSIREWKGGLLSSEKSPNQPKSRMVNSPNQPGVAHPTIPASKTNTKTSKTSDPKPAIPAIQSKIKSSE